MELFTGWFKGIKIVNFADKEVPKGKGFVQNQFVYSNTENNKSFPNSPIVYYVPVNLCEAVILKVNLIENDKIRGDLFKKAKAFAEFLSDNNIPFIGDYQELTDIFFKLADYIKNLFNKSKFSEKEYLKMEPNIQIEPVPAEADRFGNDFKIKMTVNSKTIENVSISDNIQFLCIEDQIIYIIGQSENYVIEYDQENKIFKITNGEGTKDYTFGENGEIVESEDTTKVFNEVPYLVLRVHGNPDAALFRNAPPFNLFKMVGTIRDVEIFLEGLKENNIKKISQPADNKSYDITKVEKILNDTEKIFKKMADLIKEAEDTTVESYDLEEFIDKSYKFECFRL